MTVFVGFDPSLQYDNMQYDISYIIYIYTKIVQCIDGLFSQLCAVTPDQVIPQRKVTTNYNHNN